MTFIFISSKFYIFLIFIIIDRSKPTNSTPTPDQDVYIIHMDPSAMPKPFSNHRNWYTTSLESISSQNLQSSKLIYTYNHVVDGFSARLSHSELDSIQNLVGFVSAKKDIEMKLDTSHSYELIGLSPNYGAWPASQFGRGIIVGLVDTGVWPESKSFSDDGMSEIPSKWKGICEFGQRFNSSLCNKKLIGARFFNKGVAANKPKANISVNSTRDIDGHGTHTSSTAVGNYVDGASFFGYAPGTIRGMAPRAHLAVYKAGWKEGIFASDIVAAVDQAVNDGVDVLSLSLGISDVALYNDPVAIATFRAVAKGIFVTTSAGNKGPYDGSVHNGIPWVLTVAASTIDRKFYGTLTLNNGILVNGSTLYTGENPVDPVRLVFMDLCQDLTKTGIIGKKIVVVCEERNNSLFDQIQNVKASNLTGGVFITNSTFGLETRFPSTFPTMFVNWEDGEKVKEFIKQSKTEATAKVEFHKTVLKEKRAPLAAGYSSRGPSPACPFVMKPDVMAPGDSILASWPDDVSVLDDSASPRLFNKFNLDSGTSMATPHVAGVAALIRAVHPDWSPSAVRSAIMTTSDITDNTGRPILDVGFFNGILTPATPLAMGSGHVNPNKALNPGLVYNTTTQDYIDLICGLNFTHEQIKIITGDSSSNCPSASLDLNYPSFIAFFNLNGTGSSGGFTVKEFKRTVTNVDDGPGSYTAEVTRINGFNITVVPEKLHFQSKFETKNFVVKMEGPRTMKGDKDFGYLTWRQSDGKYVVRSPIVVTSLSSDVLSS